MNFDKIRVLYIHSEPIHKVDIIWGLLELGIDTEVSAVEVSLTSINEEQIQALRKELQGFDYAITQNFSVNVAEACHDTNIKYISWVYDSPQVPLYTSYALYPENFIFCFDKKQVERLKEIGVENVFYQPLAANIPYTSTISISDSDIQQYSCDVSFIGQLYHTDSFSNYMNQVKPEEKAQLLNIINSLSCNWRPGVSIYSSFDTSLSEALYKYMNHQDFEIYNVSPQFIEETLILAPGIAQTERKRVLKESSLRYKTNLYTKDSDVECAMEIMGGRGVHPYVNGEIPYKIYYSSKINLNITLRSIETGAPQRIFDIMGVGGLVMSNYQEELTELFVPDKEIVLFRSIEEYLEKADYLLKHDSERIKIAVNGYNRVKQDYNYSKSLYNIFKKTI